MTAYLYNAPAGVVGDVTRLQNSVIEPVLLGEAFTAFGKPFKFDATTGKAMNIAASDTAAVFAGIITRVIPAISGDLSQTLAGGVPSLTASQGALRRGFCNVLCTVGTPVKGGVVYLRVVAGSGKLVGDLEATADSTNNVALPGVEWAVSGKDADNIAELYIK